MTHLIFKVLIVEDVPEMLGMLVDLIGKLQNFKVSGTAKNISEARLEIHRRRPDLVLLDEVLPGESSLDLLQELTDEDLPVVLMSSMSSPSEILPTGATTRIVKPNWKDVKVRTAQIHDILLQAVMKKK